MLIVLDYAVRQQLNKRRLLVLAFFCIILFVLLRLAITVETVLTSITSDPLMIWLKTRMLVVQEDGLLTFPFNEQHQVVCIFTDDRTRTRPDPDPIQFGSM